jgi:dTDP-4-dehydrorhamnose reductase
MKKILIIGKGYIGEYLHLTLSETFTTRIVNKDNIDYTQRGEFSMFLDNFLSETREDTIVINCVGYAGRPNVDACESEEAKPQCLFLNAILPQQIASACKQKGIAYIHVSSGCIYDRYEKDFTESDKPNFGMYSNESSFYSKSKHLGELNLNSLKYGNIFRIRMPFCSSGSERSILSKIQKYPKLISCKNSMTCVEDLCEFTKGFIAGGLIGEFGIYNVVNTGSSSNKTIADILKDQGKNKQEWSFVSESELNLKAKRSNCVLDTAKITRLGLALPNVNASLEKCISKLKIQ